MHSLKICPIRQDKMDESIIDKDCMGNLCGWWDMDENRCYVASISDNIISVDLAIQSLDEEIRNFKVDLCDVTDKNQ